MKTAIVLCSDGNYVEPTAVFIDSFAENYHYRRDIDIVVIMPESDVSGFKKLKALVSLDARFTLKLVTVSASEYPEIIGLSLPDRTVYESVWYRLFLGSLLKEYDKAIYFDSDIMIINNVQPILDYPMRGKLMAICDIVGLPYLYNLDDLNDIHFLTGVLIMDLNWWRESGVETKFREDLLANGSHYLMDEYLLNKYVKDEWYPMPFTFNFHAFKTNSHAMADWDKSFLPMHFYKTAIAVHFTGPLKPWNYQEIVGVEDTSALGSEWRRRRMLLGSKREPRNLI